MGDKIMYLMSIKDNDILRPLADGPPQRSTIRNIISFILSWRCLNWESSTKCLFNTWAANFAKILRMD